MWNKKKVSVIFPTFNEKESIRDAIEDFFACGYVDEIVVVNNNAVEGTSEEVEKTHAIQVFEKRQGYGRAIRRGFKEVTGDIIIISEPDGTFMGDDVLKLLAYSNQFDAVFGTRTTKGLIWKGANMGPFLKWGNIIVAKMIELLFLSPAQLTDVGCTMRLIKRDVLRRIEDKFSVEGSCFGPEMIILTILHNINFVEIPVNYRKRVGRSSVTGDPRKAFFLGLAMIGLVIKMRIKCRKRWIEEH